MGKGEHIGDLQDHLGDKADDFARHGKALMDPSQHTAMLIFVALTSLIMTAVGAFSNTMVIGKDWCDEPGIVETNQEFAAVLRYAYADAPCETNTECNCPERLASKDQCRVGLVGGVCEADTVQEPRVGCRRSGKCVGHTKGHDFIAYSAGLWSVNFGGAEAGKLCSDWPAEVDADNNLINNTDITSEVCTNVKASRVLWVMAVGFFSIGTFGGIVRFTDHKEYFPIPTAALVVLGGICGASAYIIWESSVQRPLGRALKSAINAQLEADGRELSQMYYDTLGYSYGILLFAWLWPLSVILSKIFLPNLEISEADKEAERRRTAEAAAASAAEARRSGIGVHETSFAP